MKSRLRGQEVDINGMEVSMTVRKPLGTVFSINDQVFEMIQRGYIGIIEVGKIKVRLTKENQYMRQEEVKSKFPGLPPWHRYWYVIPKETVNAT